MPAAVQCNTTPSAVTLSPASLSSPLALSSTLVNPIAGTAAAALIGQAVASASTTPSSSAFTPSSERPPLLSHNSTSTIDSTRSMSLSASPSDADTIYSRRPSLEDTAALRAYPFYGDRTQVIPEYETSAQVVSGLVGPEESVDLKPIKKTASSNGQSSSEAKANTSSNSETNFQQSFYDPNQVKHRRRTTAAQLEVLDAHFQESSKPDFETRRKISSQLGMTVREVQVWFQNRRAKQKKLESRALAAAERGLSDTEIKPATLTAPPSQPQPSALQNGYYGAHAGQNIEPFNSLSGYSAAYSQPPFITGQAATYNHGIPYYDSAHYPSQVPRQQQLHRFSDSQSNYSHPSFTYAHNERALSPGSYFAQNYGNSDNQQIQPWSPNQQHYLNGDSHSASVSVSPVSSRSSVNDDTHIASRRRSVVPAALSNLSGMSILPDSALQSPTESNFASTAMPLANGAAPIPLTASVMNTYSTYLPTYAPVIPSIPAAAVPPVLSPTATVFPMALSPVAPEFPSTIASVPTYVAPAVSTVPLMDPLAQSVPGVDPLTQPVPLQTVVQAPVGFDTILNAPLAPSLATTPAALQMSATLAARRQSAITYPEQVAAQCSMQAAGTMQQQPVGTDLQASSSLPRGFNFIDNAGSLLRRASTSAIASATHQRHPSTMTPMQQRPIVPTSATTTPLNSPPTTTGVALFGVSSAPISPAPQWTKSNPSMVSALDDTPILGGLRRGSIAKRVKSPAELYQPYPHPQVIRKNSSGDVIAAHETRHE